MAEPRADTVRQYLEAVDAFQRRFGQGADRRHRSPEALVLELGRPFHPHPYPRSWRRGPKKQCFTNALGLVGRTPVGLRYAEGYAFSGDIVTLHGWCVSHRDWVYDPTWAHPATCEYIGVIVPWEELRVRLDRAGGTLPLLLHDPLALRDGWAA